MNLDMFAVAWAVLVVATVILAVYRRLIANNEDDLVHIGEGEEKFIPHQVEVAQKLNAIDRFGKILTAVSVVTGVTLGGAYMYQGWFASMQLH